MPHGSFNGDAAVLNRAVVVYLAMALLGLVLGRLAIVLVARIGEGFLRRMRNQLFAPHDGALARLLRDREDRAASSRA